MAQIFLPILLLVLTPNVLGASLRQPPAKTQIVAVKADTAKAAPAKVVGDEAQVAQYREKLTKISGGFTKMLSGKTGTTHVGTMIAKVNTMVEQVLAETKNAKDVKKALKQLEIANAAIKQLSADVTHEQTQLMHEGEEQEQSLLLGVLMQRQKDPMSKQLEVLQSDDFKSLPVVAAVLAKKDTKTPLFQQVAAYLDAHSPPKPVEPQIPDKLKKGKDGKPDVTPIVLALEARLQKMEDSEKRMEEHHEEEMRELDRVALEKKNNTRAVHQIKRLQKSDDRTFVKQSALAKLDIQTMKSAIESVRKGDISGLAKAQKALDKSMEVAKARTGKFLVFVQLVHQAEELDCPYCVAQCVDKCHNDGKPYTTCLTDCADAGKGK
jgi:hypothetical protein|mmetsp:Transcript_57525/g.91491  ORF Transcript_57525/g.91491 Transcript_57525/m.91491 type:complete len:380 (-) Transcript_57525:209-1348(-)|eukprot:CAMPEP_0169097114 /NCGR_PEP_ID=MMETSP1015-20121227/19351_1 /TAXON_ID=342587 /ORGANISM="Karlodinium micrum, Strain CCMP2283" /LENGTH=379 /DNA_ID=CAMNT_0009157907 /DNA_START=46 /DNA_END=1185 /DNA_ORIENTATION=+